VLPSQTCKACEFICDICFTILVCTLTTCEALVYVVKMEELESKTESEQGQVPWVYFIFLSEWGRAHSYIGNWLQRKVRTEEVGLDIVRTYHRPATVLSILRIYYLI
jgi:hypothetical protein